MLTAKLLVKKWPKNQSTIIMLGRYYELKGDTTAALEYYKSALSNINNVLTNIGHVPDSTNAEYNEYLFEETEKAKVLILLNQPEKAHDILKDVSGKETNETVKRFLNQLIVMDRHGCLLYLRPTPTF